jgi:hypothetical protein
LTADLPVTALLVAVEKEARQTGRLQDDTSTAKPAWHNMAERFDMGQFPPHTAVPLPVK